ncbi:MAG: hypothetical protein HY695_30475 [Deltaproteobacteria bacterium]|nr:hypothetical protein [Deltaproteobacteria bacterium]
MARRIKRYPPCEICGKTPATSFSWFQKYNDESGLSGEWKFVCACTSGFETYYVEFESFFSSPAETASWLAHLRGKSWMDWNDFANMMRRFEHVSKKAA